MILIIDNDKLKRSSDLRSALFDLGIPSFVVDGEHIRDYPEVLAAVTFVSSESELNIISVRLGRIPLLAINESRSRIYNKDVTFYDAGTHSSYVEFVCSYVEKYCKMPIGYYTCGELSVSEDIVTVGIIRFKMTATEKRILSCLILCRDRWVSERSLLKSCFAGSGKAKSGKVSVHICNINNKVKSVIGKHIILCKRGVGYKLDPYI